MTIHKFELILCVIDSILLFGGGFYTLFMKDNLEGLYLAMVGVTPLLFVLMDLVLPIVADEDDNIIDLNNNTGRSNSLLDCKYKRVNRSIVCSLIAYSVIGLILSLAFQTSYNNDVVIHTSYYTIGSLALLLMSSFGLMVNVVYSHCNYTNDNTRSNSSSNIYISANLNNDSDHDNVIDICQKDLYTPLLSSDNDESLGNVDKILKENGNKKILKHSERSSDVSLETVSLSKDSSIDNGNADHDEDLEANNSNSSQEDDIPSIWRLLSLARPERLYIFIGCIVLVIRLPFSLSIPHFVSVVIGSLSAQKYTQARDNVLYLFVFGSIDSLLDFWCVYLFGKANCRIVKKLRCQLFATILKQETAFFDSIATGELISRLTSDCGNMAQNLTWFFRFSIESTIRISFIVVYLIYRSPKLGGVACSIIPFVAVINKVYGDFLSQNAKAAQNALGEANDIAQEALVGIRTVLAFSAESKQYSNYHDAIHRNYLRQVQQTIASGIYYMSISTFLINTCVQALILLIGISLVHKGSLDAGGLVAFMLYQNQLQGECLNFFGSYSALKLSTGVGDKVFSLLDRKPKPPATGCTEQLEFSKLVPTEEVSTKSNNCCLEFQDVSFWYDSRPNQIILNKLNLKIERGKTLALVGKSGCGKSTIISLLERFYDPKEGSILYDGINIKNLCITNLRKNMSIVTQDPALFTGSVLSNIVFGSTATEQEAIQAAKLANAHSFIESFGNGYETNVGERGLALSGGEKQRVVISRALVRKPQILLLDEATSALDYESERQVQDALDTFLSNSEITTVVVAHRLQTIRNADCIAVVKDGQIVEQGSHVELMQHYDGHYRSLVEHKMINAQGEDIIP